MANGYQTFFLTKSYRGILCMYLWYYRKTWWMLANLDTKRCRDQNCVAATGAFGKNVPTFGCRGNMSPTCRQLSQPSYQPSGSKSSVSVGTTVQEQHEQYFEARGDLRPAHTIFFEQLIAQLISWKPTDSNIILLGDFNENVYSGRIAKRLSLPDLLLTKQCLQYTGVHIPPTF